MLLVQIYVLWVFIDGTLAEYTSIGELNHQRIVELLDWLHAPLWRKRFMVGYTSALVVLAAGSGVGLFVVSIVRIARREPR